MTADGWLLIGGYLLCGMATSALVYHFAFRRRAPQDGGVVVLMVPIWPVVVAAVALYCVALALGWVVTLGEMGRPTRGS